MARLNVLRERRAAAEPLYDRALRIQQQTLPANSPELLPALDELASLALDEKDYSTAETRLRQALAIRESSLGPLAKEVARNLDQLGAIYVQQKQFAEAAKVLERSLFIWTKTLGPDSSELTAKYQGLAEIYRDLTRPADAEPLVQQVLAARENETVGSLNTLASICIAKDDLAAAEPLYRLSLTILDKGGILTGRRSADGSDTNLELLAETASQYAALLKRMNREAEAARLETQIRAIAGKSYAGRRKTG